MINEEALCVTVTQNIIPSIVRCNTSFNLTYVIIVYYSMCLTVAMFSFTNLVSLENWSYQEEDFNVFENDLTTQAKIITHMILFTKTMTSYNTNASKLVGIKVASCQSTRSATRLTFISL